MGFFVLFFGGLREGLAKNGPPLEMKESCSENWRGLSVHTETGDESEWLPNQASIIKTLLPFSPGSPPLLWLIALNELWEAVISKKLQASAGLGLGDEPVARGPSQWNFRAPLPFVSSQYLPSIALALWRSPSLQPANHHPGSVC